eukprot:SAG22_NODE_235_length_14319_cov_3.248805_8_plen_457_part_01
MVHFLRELAEAYTALGHSGGWCNPSGPQPPAPQNQQPEQQPEPQPEQTQLLAGSEPGPTESSGAVRPADAAASPPKALRKPPALPRVRPEHKDLAADVALEPEDSTPSADEDVPPIPKLPPPPLPPAMPPPLAVPSVERVDGVPSPVPCAAPSSEPPTLPDSDAYTSSVDEAAVEIQRAKAAQAVLERMRTTRARLELECGAEHRRLGTAVFEIGRRLQEQQRRPGYSEEAEPPTIGSYEAPESVAVSECASASGSECSSQLSAQQPQPRQPTADRRFPSRCAADDPVGPNDLRWFAEPQLRPEPRKPPRKKAREEPALAAPPAPAPRDVSSKLRRGRQTTRKQQMPTPHYPACERADVAATAELQKQLTLALQLGLTTAARICDLTEAIANGGCTVEDALSQWRHRLDSEESRRYDVEAASSASTRSESVCGSYAESAGHDELERRPPPVAVTVTI